MDEDDDFGGFEAADPIPPTAAADLIAHGVEASPSPWAVFSPGSSSVGVRPDILCGENKFPQLLDPTVPNDDTAVGPSSEQATSVEQNAFHENVPEGAQANAEQVVDDATLANSILDGSFRAAAQAASNNTSSSHVISSDQSVASGDSSDLRLRLDQFPANDTRQPQNAFEIDNDVSKPVDKSIPFVADFSDKFKENEQDSGTGSDTSSWAPVAMGFEKQDLNKSEIHVSENEETNTSGFNSILSSDKMEASGSKSSSGSSSVNIPSHESSPSVNNSGTINEFNEELAEEVQKLRQESQTAVSAVISEYKELMVSSLQKQQESTEQHIKLCLQQQEETFQNLLRQQEKDYEAKLKAEKEAMEKEKTSALEKQREELQEQFEKFLEEEAEKNKEALKTTLEEERLESKKLISSAMEDERKQYEDKLQQQKEEFTNFLKEERIKNEEKISKTLERERNSFQETLQEAVMQERNKGEEKLKMAKAEIENRKTLAMAVQQRQFASLNVFLDSAKQQLSLLTELNNSSTNSESENSGDTNS